MKHKIVWVNDTSETQLIYLGDFMGDPIAVPEFSTKVLSVELPEGKDFFIKQWSTGITMVSYCDKIEEDV